jgi:uncharacterized OB-fold protein
MIPKKVDLEYLGYRVSGEFPVCPKCGRVYIPEDIVNSKIKRLEQMLEDK